MDAARDKRHIAWLGQDERQVASETHSVLPLAREEWIRRYTGRILQAWFHQEAPLGLAWTYANWIRKELCAFYGQPLLKVFIERTFGGQSGRDT